MNKILFIIILLFIISCTTTERIIKSNMSSPPEIYIPNTNIKTTKDLIKEYQITTIKITEWQKWYNLNAGTNHFTIPFYTNQ